MAEKRLGTRQIDAMRARGRRGLGECGEQANIFAKYLFFTFSELAYASSEGRRRPRGRLKYPSKAKGTNETDRGEAGAAKF